MTLDEMLTLVYHAGGSDLHLCQGTHPIYRAFGQLHDLSELTTEAVPTLDHDIMSRLLDQFIWDNERMRLTERGDVDTSYTFLLADQPARGISCRINIFRESGRLAAAFRIIPDNIPTMDELRLPASVRNLINAEHGLVVICGPTGSGKTTTLASLVEGINQGRGGRIITIEDPIEYRFKPKQAVISQRQIGMDCQDFSAGLRAGLRQDPDVLLVGEMRDEETIGTALTAAETGHLVFTTLHTSNVIEAVDRILQSFPSIHQQQLRNELANCMTGIVAQKLLLSPKGGRVAAFEVLLPTIAVRNLIRTGRVHQLRDYMPPSEGMITMEQSITGLKNLHLL